MKIKFSKHDKDQLKLIAQMGDRNKNVAIEAQETFAALIEPVLDEVFNQADTTSLVYNDLTFNGDDSPEFPIDIFQGTSEDHFTVWSSPAAGGLPTNHFHLPINEVKFTTYRLDSAISYDKKYARKSRLDVVAAALERLVQEVMLKNQNNAWSVVLAALANAEHNGNKHVYKSIGSVLSMDDLNKFITYFRRLNRSFAGGTPVDGVNRPTDMIVSPEIMERLRTFAYNPLQTKAIGDQVAGTEAGGIALPDEDRMSIFRNGGAPEFFGISVVELLELGINQKYETLFAGFAGSTSYNKIDASASDTFNATTDDLMILVDASKRFAWRAIEERDPAFGDSVEGPNPQGAPESFNLEVDDQFTRRSDKLGWFGWTNVGYLVTDSKPLAGLFVGA